MEQNSGEIKAHVGNATLRSVKSYGLRPSVHTIHPKFCVICHFQYYLEQIGWIVCTLGRKHGLSHASVKCASAREVSCSTTAPRGSRSAE